MLTQDKPCPHEDTEVDGEQQIAEERSTYPQVGVHCAAEVAREQDRTEDRRPGNNVHHNAGEQNGPDESDVTYGIPELAQPPDDEYCHQGNPQHAHPLTRGFYGRAFPVRNGADVHPPLR